MIGEVASAFAGAAGEEDDVAIGEGSHEARAEVVGIVVNDAKIDGLAAELADGIGDDTGVAVEDEPWPHHFSWRNDFVAGGENGDAGLANDGDMGDADGCKHARFAAGEDFTGMEH